MIKNNKGFTLVEIIISTAILIGITYFAASAFKSTKTTSKSTEMKSASLNTVIELAIKTAQNPEFFFNFAEGSNNYYEVRCYSTLGIQMGESVFKNSDFKKMQKECYQPDGNQPMNNLMFQLHQRWIDSSNIEVQVFIFDRRSHSQSITTKTFKVVAKNAL